MIGKMFRRIKWDRSKWRLMSSDVSPYTGRDFLEIDDYNLPIDESLLRYKFDKETKLPKPDFLFAATRGVLICRPQIWDNFKHLNIGKIKSYSGDIEGAKITFICTMNEVSGFNYISSDFDFWPESNDISEIYSLKLVDGFYANFDIFRLSDEEACRFELIVSDEFVDVYNSNHLTGLTFEIA